MVSSVWLNSSDSALSPNDTRIPSSCRDCSALNCGPSTDMRKMQHIASKYSRPGRPASLSVLHDAAGRFACKCYCRLDQVMVNAVVSPAAGTTRRVLVP